MLCKACIPDVFPSAFRNSVSLQDVPVKLESIRRLVEVAEPDLPPPDVKLLMPKLRVLARVLDKMKTVRDRKILVWKFIVGLLSLQIGH